MKPGTRIFAGEAIEDPAAYGRRANAVFAAFRAAAGPAPAQFDLVVGTHAFDPERNAALLAAAPLANSLAIAPYLMRSVTEWANDDQLYGPLLAQPEEMSREGFVAAAAQSAGGRQLAVYEVNLHTTGGTAPEAILDRFTPSAAAGLAVAGHMLRMMRDHGVRDEMLFSLPQYEFRRPDGTPVRLWGSVVEMGADGRKRPQFLAESLANRAIRGDLVKVEITGENPTHDQPPGNDGVSLRRRARDRCLRLSGRNAAQPHRFQLRLASRATHQRRGCGPRARRQRHALTAGQLLAGRHE